MFDLDHFIVHSIILFVLNLDLFRDRRSISRDRERFKKSIVTNSRIGQRNVVGSSFNQRVVRILNRFVLKLFFDFDRFSIF